MSAVANASAGLTLESESVVLQKYRRQPWLRHFWVRCDVCATHKLYWPTARQMSLAERLRCRTVTDESAPTDVTVSYAKCNGLPVTERRQAPPRSGDPAPGPRLPAVHAGCDQWAGTRDGAGPLVLPRPLVELGGVRVAR